MILLDKNVNKNESVFDLLRVSFTEYEIIETEKEITKTVNGKEITETVIEEEYIIVRELEINGYAPIKELLKSLNYDTSGVNMSVKKVTGFLEDLNKKEEYEIETVVLTDEEISEVFDEKHKGWFLLWLKFYRFWTQQLSLILMNL